MDSVSEYLPTRVNSGSLLVAYTLTELEEHIRLADVVLPICSLGTSVEELKQLAPLVLPPLYHEALDKPLKSAIIDRIRQCFPYYVGSHKRDEYRGKLEVVELPRAIHNAPAGARVLGFSVDTAVEQHGPHLPLATDTIQSYSVLNQLAREVEGFLLGPPVEYGQLTWGLPYGMSIDITAPLLARYVTSFANAILQWCSPESLYVVDVHGSLVHRQAIQDGLAGSRCDRYTFRWLHEPLVEFAGDRGDQHAGGVETALVHHIGEELVDPRWWPARLEELAARQLSVVEALELSSDLPRFIRRVQTAELNGIVGDITNFNRINPNVMSGRMLDTARNDVELLLSRCT